MKLLSLLSAVVLLAAPAAFVSCSTSAHVGASGAGVSAGASGSVTGVNSRTKRSGAGVSVNAGAY